MDGDIDKDIAIVKSHLEKLGEHFDSVHIFASRHESGIEDGTVSVNLGSGNWFARYGQVKEWTIKQDEETRIGVRKNKDE